MSRLSEFRVPVGSEISLIFRRKRRSDGADYVDILEAEAEQERQEEEAVRSEEERYRSEEEGYTSGGGGGRSGDDDEDGSRNGNSEDEDEVGSPPVSSPWSSGPPSEGFDRVAFISLQSEVDDLREQVETLMDEMGVMRTEKEELTVKIQQLEEQLLQSESEKTSLVRQVEEQMSEKLNIERKLNHSELQLQHLILNAEKEKNRNLEVMNDVRDVCGLVRAGKQVRVSTESEGWLSGCGLGPEVMNEDASVEASKRIGLSVAAAVDPTGLILRKWSLMSQTPHDKLNRFESRLKKLSERIGIQPQDQIPESKDERY